MSFSRLNILQNIAKFNLIFCRMKNLFMHSILYESSFVLNLCNQKCIFPLYHSDTINGREIKNDFYNFFLRANNNRWLHENQMWFYNLLIKWKKHKPSKAKIWVIYQTFEKRRLSEVNIIRGGGSLILCSFRHEWAKKRFVHFGCFEDLFVCCRCWDKSSAYVA